MGPITSHGHHHVELTADLSRLTFKNLLIYLVSVSKTDATVGLQVNAEMNVINYF